MGADKTTTTLDKFYFPTDGKFSREKEKTKSVQVCKFELDVKDSFMT